jgi:hypothetical protein
MPVDADRTEPPCQSTNRPHALSARGHADDAHRLRRVGGSPLEWGADRFPVRVDKYAGRGNRNASRSADMWSETMGADMAVAAYVHEAKAEEARQRAQARLEGRIEHEGVATVNAMPARSPAQLKDRRHHRV